MNKLMNNIMCNVRRLFACKAVSTLQVSLIAVASLTVSCSDENDAFNASKDAVELTGIETVITEQPASTRAGGSAFDEIKPIPGYIGRQFFVSDDEMVITKFQRTENSIIDYSYSGIQFKSNEGGAWSRSHTDGNPERIYWTDNINPHTFIGYSCPQSWKNADSKWQAVEVPATEKEPKKVNYHGYFTYTSKTESNGAVVNEVDFSDSTKIADEDILITYDTDKQAETGGSVAILHYKHALASAKITVNILNFAAEETSQDVNTKVYDLQILEQPYKYMWAQIPVSDVNGIDHPGWGAQKITPTEEPSSVTIKTWLKDAEGIGNNRNKTFVFRSLIVPGKQNEVKLRFKVRYPQALNPAETVEKTYTATLRGTKPGETNGVYFEPGKCTNINISLNHKNEAITIGAEYVDWENVETPDETNLSKYSTYLDTTVKDSVTVAGETNATADDATWLYFNGSSDLVDIYGNHGTKDDPFEIRNARQFLSFAYEVKQGNGGSGRDFKDLFVRLDASLLLQPTESVDDTLSYAKIDWIGIGDTDKPFNGTFLGGMRYVRYLKGKPLFMNIGASGRVEGLTLDRVIGLTDGGGMVAGTNSGTICAAMAEVHKKNAGFTGTALSGICGTNSGAIVACGVIGNISTPIAGICANNTGSITVSYAGINNTGLVTTNSGAISGCYYDSDKAVNPVPQDGAEGLPTLTMQRTGFVETLNTALQSADDHAKTHTFQYRAAYYPKVQ